MEKKRIYYGGNEHQFGDLRLPEGEGPHPVAVVIHGGFWKAEISLDNMTGVANDLTNRGIATWTIEYRRVGHEGGSWPGTFTDASEAVDYLHTLQETYDLDLNRVITIGHSAGGHLALWTAGRHRLPAASEVNVADHPVRLKAAISLAGVNDLRMMHEVHHIRDVRNNQAGTDPVANLMGGSPDDVAERYAAASPSELLPLGVKQVLIHGALDINVPVGISSSYHREAEELDDEVKMIELPTVEHFKLIDPNSEAWQVIAEEVRVLLF